MFETYIIFHINLISNKSLALGFAFLKKGETTSLRIYHVSLKIMPMPTHTFLSPLLQSAFLSK